jgi:hypothetical protein
MPTRTVSIIARSWTLPRGGESLETLNRERDELFRALRAAAERLDDAGREIGWLKEDR